MTKDPRPAALEILQRAERLTRFPKSLSLTYGSDERDIVERNLEVISEASRRLPDAFKGQHPEIDWRRLADFGNVLRHGYDSVSESILIDILRHQLEPLAATVRIYLAALTDEE